MAASDSSSKLPPGRRVPRPAEDKVPTAFGRRLEKAIEHAGTTQTSLERSLGMNRGRLSRLRYVEVDRMSVPDVKALSDACGVDYAWLSTGVDKMLPKRDSPVRMRIDETPAPPSDVREKPPSVR